MKAALIAAKAASNLPVICQMTYAEDGRTITGTPPKAAAILLDSMGADIIGANCSLGPDKLFNVAKEMIAATIKPIIIQPNGGMSVLDNGETLFLVSKNSFVFLTGCRMRCSQGEPFGFLLFRIIYLFAPFLFVRFLFIYIFIWNDES